MKATSSKKKSPWKVTHVRGSHSGGIVIPKGAILVNQGLGKIKLEEDYVEQKPDLSSLLETDKDGDGTFGATSSDAVSSGGAVTEVEVDIPMSSEGTPVSREGDINGSSNSCREEIVALKCTVKQLTLQMETQNEAMKKHDEENKKLNLVIREMKYSFRNAVMSLMACCEDSEENKVGHGSNDIQEPPMKVNA